METKGVHFIVEAPQIRLDGMGWGWSLAICCMLRNFKRFVFVLIYNVPPYRIPSSLRTHFSRSQPSSSRTATSAVSWYHLRCYHCGVTRFDTSATFSSSPRFSSSPPSLRRACGTCGFTQVQGTPTSSTQSRLHTTPVMCFCCQTFCTRGCGIGITW